MFQYQRSLVHRKVASTEPPSIRPCHSNFPLVGLVVAAASLTGKDLKGGVKFVVDQGRKVLVGATFVGPSAGEMVHAATIAIVGEVSLDTLWHATPAFPTMSELWLRFLEAYGY